MTAQLTVPHRYTGTVVAMAALTTAHHDTPVGSDNELATDPSSATYQRAWLRPGPLHPVLATAALGCGAHDMLHYAVKDADPLVLERVLEHLTSRPATWEVLAPAVANAPEARPDQLASLLGVLLSDPPGFDEVLTADTAAQVVDRLLDEHTHLLLDVLHTAAGINPTGATLLAVCETIASELATQTQLKTRPTGIVSA